MNHKRKFSQDTRKLEGRYANYFEVGHNAFEFVIDAGQFYSESAKAELCARIITPPIYAKTLLEILESPLSGMNRPSGLYQVRMTKMLSIAGEEK